jgi:hypothetical protein
MADWNDEIWVLFKDLKPEDGTLDLITVPSEKAVDILRSAIR